ncbi:LemA family protein [Parvibium lacunae]|uniref:LemA family protein n=1 Tax=Parvibium lacunae TaxID=1888893 RepID=A0A368L0Y6_9BURK|nr:LemA family protein [Parvibium lacunae]RCS57077.1 hypothetical protein DU000_09735 [Parvibium lacunae]
MMGFWLLLIFPALWGIGAHQRLRRLRLEAASQCRELRLALYKRYDLIPHLAEAVAGYLKHEREQIEQLIALRTQATQSLDLLYAELEHLRFNALPTLLHHEARLRLALNGLLNTLQQQADALGDPNVQRWQQQLQAQVEPIYLRQQEFNRAIERHNRAVTTPPASCLAWLLRYRPIALFEPDAVRLPKV